MLTPFTLANNRTSQNGSALIITLILLTILSLIGIGSALSLIHI